MKYPYIGKTELGSIVLFHKESTGRVIKHVGSIPVGRVDGDWCEIDFKNITRDYLQNTYGEVKSPEHAEFIIELGKNAKAEISTEYSNGSFFNFYTGPNGELYLGFFDRNLASDSGEKQITIPLPPKQIQTATPEEEFEMTQIEKSNGITVNLNNNTENEVSVTKSDNDTVTITVDKPLKNAGDNLVLGWDQDFKVAREIINELREESNCSDELLDSRDEWPCVGDEVLVFSSARRLAEIKGKAVKVIGKCTHSDGDTILTVEHSSFGVFAVAKESCIKPKTPEEELRDELINNISSCLTFIPGMLDKSDDVMRASHQAACKLMSKYNITKKPQ